MEGLRLHSVTHVGPTIRYARQELVVTTTTRTPYSYVIPKGSLVWFPSLLAHRDDNYFERPHEFDPTRWGRAPLPTASYMPFGGGSSSSSSSVSGGRQRRHRRQQCIGQQWAQSQIRILLVAILQNFQLELVDDDDGDDDEEDYDGTMEEDTSPRCDNSTSALFSYTTTMTEENETMGIKIRFLPRTRTTVTRRRTPTHTLTATCSVSRMPRGKHNDDYYDHDEEDSGLIWSFLSPRSPTSPFSKLL